jgi:uncharacterized protein RhaS with RHS repeats
MRLLSKKQCCEPVIKGRRRRASKKPLYPDFCGVISGSRYYNPSTGRWLSRDPSQDTGNLYQFCSNDAVNAYDPVGLLTIDPYRYQFNVSFDDPDVLGQTLANVTQTGKTVGCGFLWRNSKLTGYGMELQITIQYGTVRVVAINEGKDPK